MELFSYTQVKDVRVSMFTVLAGWRRVHNSIAGSGNGLPLDGGLYAPMAVSFNPIGQLAPIRPKQASIGSPTIAPTPAMPVGAFAPGTGLADPGAGLPPSAAELAAGAPAGALGGTAAPHLTNVRALLAEPSHQALGQAAAGYAAEAPAVMVKQLPGSWQPPPLQQVPQPVNNETIAFMSIRELGALLRTRKVTAVELAQLFLARLRRFDPALEFVVTYTEDLAMQQAAEADNLLAQVIPRPSST